jgi:hypothetical protein
MSDLATAPVPDRSAGVAALARSAGKSSDAGEPAKLDLPPPPPPGYSPPSGLPSQQK